MLNLGHWRKLAMGRRFIRDLLNWLQGLKSCMIAGTWCLFDRKITIGLIRKKSGCNPATSTSFCHTCFFVGTTSAQLHFFFVLQFVWISGSCFLWSFRLEVLHSWLLRVRRVASCSLFWFFPCWKTGFQVLFRPSVQFVQVLKEESSRNFWTYLVLTFWIHLHLNSPQTCRTL